MSDKEIRHLVVLRDVRDQRIVVLRDVRDQRITQIRAAELLNLSTRQITRLLQKFNQGGLSALFYASRDQPGYHRHDEVLKFECHTIISECFEHSRIG